MTDDDRQLGEDARHLRFIRWAVFAILVSWSAAGAALWMAAC